MPRIFVSIGLNDALELHLAIHPQRENTTFVKYQRRVFATLTAITGDKAVAAFERADARRYSQSGGLQRLQTQPPVPQGATQTQ